jgi:regulator of replication initiation timing
MNKEKKLRKKELRELMTEQSYTIEAFENEIEDLEEVIKVTKAKLWEVIQENDRLTMRYEPYRPPGDQHEDYDFYELIEENKSLKKKIRLLSEQNTQLLTELRDIRVAMREMKPLKRKHPKGGVVSFDFWPPSDWFRLKYDKWTPGMAAQLCIGPLRIDWFAI